MSKKKKLFLLFSHQPTPEQLVDARVSLGVESIVEMPGELREIWHQIPPDAEAVDSFLGPVKEWLVKNSRQGDIALIQGDFGATYLMVNFVGELGLVLVYSTTTRRACEKVQKDGSVKTEHVFRHRRFRVYGS